MILVARLGSSICSLVKVARAGAVKYNSVIKNSDQATEVRQVSRRRLRIPGEATVGRVPDGLDVGCDRQNLVDEPGQVFDFVIGGQRDQRRSGSGHVRISSYCTNPQR